MRNILTLSLFFVFALNGLSQNTDNTKDNHPNVNKIVVVEVLQTTSYTYIKGAQKDKVQWMAIPKMEASKGDTYYYHGGMEMVDFQSKELDRIFSSVLFLNGLIDPEIVEGGKMTVDASPEKSTSAEEETELDIEPAIGGITIAELFTNKEKYANKVVKVRGKVSKYNTKIMNKNWIHLQDGSSDSGEFDFTITTAEEAKVGEIITVEGIITLDKDFGAGYFYSLIMENGKLSK